MTTLPQTDAAEALPKAKRVQELTDIAALRDYLNRVGAVPRSMLTAAIIEREGQYSRDVATIRLDKATGEVTLRRWPEGDATEFAPTDLECAKIKEAAAKVRWPEPQRLHRIVDPHPLIKSALPEDIFEFRDTDGQIIMVQVRVAREDGSKDYLPLTFYDDDQWRIVEPDELLPLYNVERLKDCPIVFLHEGAKAARHAQWLAEAAEMGDREGKRALKEHPWGEQLIGAVHLGWTGGAPNPHRTDWSVLAKMGVKRVHIVNDNDVVGRKAVPKIARLLSGYPIVIENICVAEDKFPVGWDLADPMPTNEHGDYDGLPMASYTVPATWLTRQLPSTGGRPAFALRSEATSLIVPIRDQECFGYLSGGVVRQASQLNKALRPFSDVEDTAKLFWRDYSQGPVDRLTYSPAQRERIIHESGQRSFNTYLPCHIRSLATDQAGLTEWFDYLDYMFPVEQERLEFARWVATLIGRPDIRMTYSLLLISTRQGKGKTTVFEAVLRPLVGEGNSALVDATALKSGFNDYAAGKRLIVCQEIYEGRNKSLADSLKSLMTDERISINKKYEKAYELPNWAVLAAASNSRRAIQIDGNDRRWFIPDVDETTVWPRERFARFRYWLRTGGLRKIKYWAEHFEGTFGGRYVQQGDHAPMSGAKEVSIFENLSDGARAVLDMAEAAAGYGDEDGKPAAIAFAALRGAAQAAMKGCQDTDDELNAVARGAGLLKFLDSGGGDRFKVGGRPQRFLINEVAAKALRECAGGPQAERAIVRQWAASWQTTWAFERSAL